jgi:hypothetical protein
VNEEGQLPDAVPGSGAGDAATSQEIPRLPKPAKTTATKKAPAKSAAKKAAEPPKADDEAKLKEALDEAVNKVAEKPVVVPSSRGPQTDKGRARDLPPPSLETKTEDKPPAPETRRIEPAVAGRPLTAGDYVRTTTPSPSTTAVIPAIKDEPRIDLAPPAASSASGRQASLRLNYVEPWSVARIAFAVSVAMMIVGVVAMTIFWVVLNLTGVWDQINEAVTSVLSDDSSSFDITDYLGFWRLIGLTLVLSAINVVLMTALATIGAHLYNLAAQVLGGVEVTFSEEN